MPKAKLPKNRSTKREAHRASSESYAGDLEPAVLSSLRAKLEWTLAQMAVVLGLRHRSQVRHLESGRTRIRGAVALIINGLKEKVDAGRRIPPPTVPDDM